MANAITNSDPRPAQAPPDSYPAEFLRAVERVLADEGGFVDDASDTGGATRFGISAAEYPALDIGKLTRADAIAIYYRDWWTRFHFALLPGEIAVKSMDLAVNIGASHAIACVQRALRACGVQADEDGVIGEGTARAASGCAQPMLLAALRSEAAGYYRTLAAIHAAQGRRDAREFLSGWLNRAYR